MPGSPNFLIPRFRGFAGHRSCAASRRQYYDCAQRSPSCQGKVFHDREWFGTARRTKSFAIMKRVHFLVPRLALMADQGESSPKYAGVSASRQSAVRRLTVITIGVTVKKTGTANGAKMARKGASDSGNFRSKGFQPGLGRSGRDTVSDQELYIRESL